MRKPVTKARKVGSVNLSASPGSRLAKNVFPVATAHANDPGESGVETLRLTKASISRSRAGSTW